MMISKACHQILFISPIHIPSDRVLRGYRCEHGEFGGFKYAQYRVQVLSGEHITWRWS